MKKKIIIIGGDPLSINSEIIFKSWKKTPIEIKKRIYLISNYELIKKQFKQLKYFTKLIKVQNINEENSSEALKIINIDCKFQDPFKINKKIRSKFVLDSLNFGHEIALDKKKISGVINCPIDKKLLNKDNFGVTEYYASKCNIKNNSAAMLIYNKNLAVSPVTTHIDIKKVSSSITVHSIVNKINTIAKWYKSNHRISPKIAILGLNPHNAENRINTEEAKIILPSIKKLRKLNISITGPYAADTIFINDFKNYDVIVGMYHDQVLSPFKALFKYDAINITLGLKYLRLSPDHGVATDLIGKNKANAASLVKCINFLNLNK